MDSYSMSCVWESLPIELSEKICNKLIIVRQINPDLKREIEEQQWKLTRFYYKHLRFTFPWANVYLKLVSWLSVNANINAYSSFCDELICREIWSILSHENREEFLDTHS